MKIEYIVFTTLFIIFLINYSLASSNGIACKGQNSNRSNFINLDFCKPTFIHESLSEEVDDPQHISIFCDNLNVYQLYSDLKILRKYHSVCSFKIIELSVSRIALRNINSTLLCGLQHLKKLHLIRIRLVNVTIDAFSHVKNSLKELVINDGVFMTLNGFVNISQINLYSLNKIENLSLRVPHLSYLHGRDFTNLPNMNRLLIESRDLREIHSNSFVGLNELKALTVKSLRNVKIVKEILKPLNSLTELRISVPDLSLSSDLFYSTNKLNLLEITSSQLFAIPYHLFIPLNDTLLNLTLAGNKIQRIDHVFELLPNLIWLDLRLNQIKILNERSFSNLKNLITLKLSDNKIINITSLAFEKNPKMISIDLENNEITRIKDSTFDHLKFLEYLNLARNRLEELPELIFANNNLLKSINLGSNKLKKLPQNVFFNQLYLEKIDLNGNKLRELASRSFSRMHNLISIDLSDNLLQSLSAINFNNSQDSLKFLSIKDNPFKCDCRMKSFREWHDEWYKNTIWDKTGQVNLQETMILTCCDYPTSLHNQLLFEINPEKFVCEVNDGKGRLGHYSNEKIKTLTGISITSLMIFILIICIWRRSKIYSFIYQKSTRRPNYPPIKTSFPVYILE